MEPSAKLLSEAEQRLTQAVREVAATGRDLLHNLKADARMWDEPDFIWNGLLRAFSTMGSSRGAELMRNATLRNRVRFTTLKKLESAQRRMMIQEALDAAEVRWPERKTKWLMVNFDRIVAEGGPRKVKARLEACQGREAKIKFLQTFTGIGDKYARNLMMDVYHPDFRDSIAVDKRVKNVTETLGLTFRNYQEEEEFYLRVARRARLNGWELDRLIYNRTSELLDALTARLR